MTKLHRELIVLYSAKQMYELINDVKRYPEFLPWCRSTEILQRTDTEMLASITVMASGISKSFITRNTLTPYEKIDMTLVSGPFKTFSSIWQFQSISPQSCLVSLDMAFEFSNKLMRVLFKKAFNHAARQMVKAFSKRADQLYSSSPSS